MIGEVATNGGIGHRLSLTELEHSLDSRGRGIKDETITTTIEAGLGYSDDRPDRRMEFYVSLNGTHGLSQHTSESRENVEAQVSNTYFMFDILQKYILWFFTSNLST